MKKEDEYKELFLAEALDQFEELNRLITELEKSPNDYSAINAIFRITHTLKGNASGMGFNQVAELSHTLETLFGEARDQKITLTPDIFTALFKAIYTLGALIRSVQDQSKVSYKGIKTKLEVICKQTDTHGIELPKERKEAVKPEEGVIVLKANQENDGVIIEIIDDGRGINIKAVLQRAIQRDLVTSEQANQLSEEETVLLIFEPGFSTVEQVNAISGRGVGMDVVKKALDSIGGKVSVQTTLGKGTSIRLSLPSSMAVKGTLLFTANHTEYAIPLAYTEAVVSLHKSDVRKVGKGSMATHLGNTIALVFLKDLFTLPQGISLYQTNVLQQSLDQLHPEASLEIIIISYGNRTVGLIVDKLLQQKEIVEKPLNRPIDDVRFISGATILGNGNACLVLHVPAIVGAIFLSHHQTGIIS